MSALLELRVKNYRSLRDVRVALRGVNVLVGPNGAGKSNFLDVIRFLGDAAREDLVPALDDRGGPDRLVFHGVSKEERGSSRAGFSISVRAMVTQYATATAPDEYNLHVFFFGRRAGDGGHGGVGRGESFAFKRYGGAGRRITLRGTKFDIRDETATAKPKPRKTDLLREDSLALSTLPRLSPQHGGAEVGRIANLFSTFRVFDIDVPKAREPSPVEQGKKLQANAANLSAFLRHLSSDAETFAALTRDARALVPGLQAIHFRSVGGPTEAVVVELEESGLSARTPIADASYGTIRILALLALMYDPEPPLLTCVEELDHGLHPWAFDRLAELMRTASERTQFILATHSPAFVNRLRAPELIVCERDLATGESRIPAIDSRQVAEMVKNTGDRLGPGELWFSGSLGGVPEESPL